MHTNASYASTFTSPISKRFHTVLLLAALFVAGGVSASAQITVSKASLTLPSTFVGTTSASTALKVTNEGAAAQPIDIVMSGDFTETDNCSGSIAAGGSCTANISFAPTFTGAISGAASIYNNSDSLLALVGLKGTGKAPLTTTPTSLSFTGQTIGVLSTAQTLKIANASSNSVTITAIKASADYTINTGTCLTAPLAGGASCTVSVQVQPTSAKDDGAIIITANAPDATPLVVKLTSAATGGPTTPISLSKTSLTFKGVSGGTSAAQTVTVTNKSASAVTMGAISASSDYAIVGNTCTGSLATGKTCTFGITFNPVFVGTIEGSAAVAYTGNNSPQLVDLTGTSEADLTAAPTKLTFSAQGVGTASTAKAVKITNNSAGAVTLRSVVSSGDFEIQGSGTTCALSGGTLAAKATCTIEVQFSPTVAGAIVGALTVTDTGSPNPLLIALAGTGTSTGFTLSASPSTLNVVQGSSGTSTIAVTDIGGFTGSVSLAASGLPSGVTASFDPSSTTNTSILKLTASASATTGTATVTVKGTSGSLTQTTTIDLTVTAPQPPVANAGGPYTGTAGTEVTFNGSGSTDPQGETLTYAWKFGDGTTGTGVSPTHTYSTAGTYTVSLTVTDTSNLTGTATTKATIGASGSTVTGSVYSGNQPISGAHVHLLAANTTGYGKPSVSLLEGTGYSDSAGSYVPTSSDGSFTLTSADYTCPVGAQVYIYALGGMIGTFTNSAAGLLADPGSCSSLGNSVVWVNEVSTIAAAYAFAGFATDATHVSSSGTALAQVGIQNAFANAANLASISTGTALYTTPAGNGVAPQWNLDTLANILNACVDSSGTITGPPNPTACYTLFNNALSGGSSGTIPSDTATAVINIAHNPGSNLATLFSLQVANPPFIPYLTTQPWDFTLGIRFTGGGVFQPLAIAIDGSGNAWMVNQRNTDDLYSVSELSSSGAPLSGADGYTGGGLDYPQYIAIDGSGNAWTANIFGDNLVEFSSSGSVLSGAKGYSTGGSPFGMAIDGFGNAWTNDAATNALIEFSSSGSILSGANGYTGGGLSGGEGIAIDGSENVWIVDAGAGAVSKFSNSGVPLSPSGGYPAGGMLNSPIAIDNSGSVWLTYDVYNSNSVTKLSNSGAVLSGPNGFTGGNLDEPLAIAIDGAGNAWIANYGYVKPGIVNGTVVELSNSGSVLSGDGYDGGGTINSPEQIAIDGSGNVWILNTGSDVGEIIGVATPVVTPLAAGVKHNTLGTRP
jgi:PKD repeat protein